MVALGACSAPLLGRPGRSIRALAFDAFVLFDPGTIVDRARQIGLNDPAALVAAASARLFAYSWFYTSSGKYVGFEMLAADAFTVAARAQGIKLDASDVDHLVTGYSNLSVWPDVPAALDLLASCKIRLAMLSNLPEAALAANLRRGQIDKHFEFVLSTDRAQRFKPSPAAYELAIRAFKTPASQIGFAASAEWDAAGATWFGYPTAWVNRSNVPEEPAYVRPRLVSIGMDGVLRLAGS
jgi:2-haloacid dehalogenase